MERCPSGIARLSLLALMCATSPGCGRDSTSSIVGPTAAFDTSGSTDVTPGISFAAHRSQPPQVIEVTTTVTLKATYTAPEDCHLWFSSCPSAPDSAGLATCDVPVAAPFGATTFVFTRTFGPGRYQFVLTLDTLKRSNNGPTCQAFTGTIPFSISSQ
jgi:hypothetical protein